MITDLRFKQELLLEQNVKGRFLHHFKHQVMLSPVIVTMTNHGGQRFLVIVDQTMNTDVKNKKISIEIGQCFSGLVYSRASPWMIMSENVNEVTSSNSFIIISLVTPSNFLRRT